MFKWLLSKLKHRTIPLEGKPYLTRYFLFGDPDRCGIGEGRGLYIHHFHSSDHERELHNHPWTGLSFILAGGYIETRCEEIGTSSCPDVYTPVETHVRKPGTFNRIGLHTFHRATLIDERKGAWTLFLTGRRGKGWGFLDADSGKFYPHDQYLAKHNEKVVLA